MPKIETQKERIAHYGVQFDKVREAHGLESDHTTHAFFLLQAAKIGLGPEEMFPWALAQCAALNEEALRVLGTGKDETSLKIQPTPAPAIQPAGPAAKPPGSPEV